MQAAQAAQAQVAAAQQQQQQQAAAAAAQQVNLAFRALGFVDDCVAKHRNVAARVRGEGTNADAPGEHGSAPAAAGATRE